MEASFTWLSPLPTLAIAVLFLIFLAISVWLIPYYFASDYQRRYRRLTSDKAAELEAQTRATIGQIVVGSVAFFGLFLALATLRATDRTIQLSQEGQLADRYTKAVELLARAKAGDTDAGSQETNAQARQESANTVALPARAEESTTVLGEDADMVARVGGVYALAGIARAADTYKEPAIRVLTALIRRASPRDRKSGPCYYLSENGHDPYAPPLDHIILGPDLTAAISVIGTIAKEMDDKVGGDLREVIDLEWSDLCFAWGKDRRYMHGWFRNADLRGAIFDNADLRCAGLPAADLRGAHLPAADLRWTDLSNADLRGANLAGAKLEGAILDGADLSVLQTPLESDQLKDACGSDKTKLSRGLKLGGKGCTPKRFAVCEPPPSGSHSRS
jgi:hypothetical protein